LRPDRIIVPVLIGVTLFGIARDVWLGPAWGRRVYRADRETLLFELQPVALKNCTMQRYGSPADGGYLMCENLVGDLATAYSYGVGPNDDWGCDVSRRYHVPVHQYDCFDPARPSCEGGRFVFHDECIAGHRQLSGYRLFDTLTNQIRRNGDTGKKMIVKVDVEGAEWASLLATPDAVLTGIDQLAMELHIVDDRHRIDRSAGRFLRLIRKLKETFYLANVHFNNQACTPETAPLPSWAFQVLFVNKRLAVLDPSVTPPAPQSQLNAPDAPGQPDCQR